MFEFQFKDIPENGSFAGKIIGLLTLDDKPVEIDTLPCGELTDEEIKKYFEHHEKILERKRNKNKS